jgi:capsular polysaccharide biosynthesis protein
MAGIQGSNQLLDLLRSLKRRRYQVIVPALLVSALGISFAVIVPKRFKVSTRVEISDRTRVETDERLRNPQEVAIRREASSASDHLVNFARVKSVIEGDLASWPEYRQARSEGERVQFIRERILTRNLTAGPSNKDPKGGTIFIDATIYDEDKTRAAKFLQNLTESWLEEMRESDRSTLIKDSAELKRILDDQEKDLKEKEDRYYAVVELLGQDPTATSGDGRRDAPGDWTFRTLEKAKSDLVDVELQLGTAEFSLQQARERLAAEPPMVPKRVEVEAEGPEAKIERLEAEKEELEEKLANLRPSNSTYRRLKPQLDDVVRELQELKALEPESVVRIDEEENPRRGEYELDVRAKEDKVGLLRDQREELQARIAALEQETKARTQHHKHLEDLLNQVNEARIATNETRREWQARDKSLQMLDSSPTPWRISQPPVPVMAGAQPNPWMISAASVVGGVALGIGLAFFSEFARSSYRSVGELAAVMSVPVLGAIDTIVTRRERRRLQLVRAMAGLSTAMIVGTIGWITYLWYSAPDRLPFELQDAIERLRTALK